MNDELVRKCVTCFYAKPMVMNEECLCSKYGIVEAGYVCNKYEVNKFLKRPPIRRSLANTQEFTVWNGEEIPCNDK